MASELLCVAGGWQPQGKASTRSASKTVPSLKASSESVVLALLQIGLRILLVLGVLCHPLENSVLHQCPLYAHRDVKSSLIVTYMLYRSRATPGKTPSKNRMWDKKPGGLGTQQWFHLTKVCKTIIHASIGRGLLQGQHLVLRQMPLLLKHLAKGPRVTCSTGSKTFRPPGSLWFAPTQV